MGLPTLAELTMCPYCGAALAGDVLKAIAAPAAGWTHQQLMAVAHEHESVTRDGADGYLGGEWIGSSEI